MAPPCGPLLLLLSLLQGCSSGGSMDEESTWRAEALESVGVGEPFKIPGGPTIRPAESWSRTKVDQRSYAVGQDLLLAVGVPDGRHLAVLAALDDLRLVDGAAAVDEEADEEELRLPAYVRADGVAWLLSGGASALDEFEAALQASSARLPASLAERTLPLAQTAIVAAVGRALEAHGGSSLKFRRGGRRRERKAAALGWVGTLLGLLMTQMPTKRQIMACSLGCSTAQVLHFAALGPGGRAGLQSQVILLVMSVLGYLDDRPWAQRGYWLHYPAILASSFFSAGDGGVLLGLLPLSATLLSVAARHQTDLFLLRLGTMLSAIPWLPYSWMVGSYSNVVGMCVFLALSGGALVRFHLLAQPPERHGTGIATAQGVPWQPGQQTRGTVTGVWLVETGDEAGKRA